jgi:hopanoid biosynthesis associated RND transporter like protein HpnN
VRLACERPWLTILASLVLAAAALAFTATHFDMTSDTAKLISPKADWRKHEQALDAAFPQNGDTTAVVIDGATPEIAEQAAADLAAALEPQTKLFASVRRPDGGPFFSREGLLFASTAEVRATADQLVSAQPFLGPMAADPSLRGVMTAISTLAEGVTSGSTDLASVDKPVRALGGALADLEHGKPTFFSWQAMVAEGGKGLKAPTRRFIVVHPKLDYAALMPGADSSDAIRAAAQRLHLDAAHGARVRITGSVALSDEEFASLADRVWLVTGAMLVAVLSMLWFAVKSKRLVGAILATTLIGLLMTTAMGLVTVGRFNLISVAFIPMFVGLGVDFGIQLCVRFRAERLERGDIAQSLVAAARGIGGALMLAATAIVLGFLAFLPTDYVGVSELGIIAGVGMVIGLVLNVTLLPALIVILKPRAQTEEVGSPAMAPVDRFLIERRGLVLWAFVIATLVSVALLPFVRFDFNPLHLRNMKGEAMSTLTDISRDPSQTINTIDVLAPSLSAADAIAARLAKLPQVDQVVTLSSFVPDDQAPKLLAIADAQLLLDPTLNPFETLPAPSDAEVVQALRDTAAKLRSAALGRSGAPGADAQRLAEALDALAAADPALRKRATDMLIPPLNTLLDQIRNMLAAQPVTLQTLPPELQADWVSKDGRARAQAAPRGDSNSNSVLVKFSKAVRSVSPDASGPPISVQQASKTISRAFIEAGVLSLIFITILLLAVLRSLREVAFTLAPIVLAGFLTLGTCVLIGQPINFANIIAFPLLFGVGVAFHIYFVMAWRAGATNLLQSSLARGVFFSAMTTGMAFGSLIFSSHPGTASMGKILMLSLIWTLVAALIFEPALLGPPTHTKAEDA